MTLMAEANPVMTELPPLGGVREDELKERIGHYWQMLGLTNQDLIASLTGDCLSKARRLAGRASEMELLRRALEEAQRRFDHALASAVGMPPSNDPHPLAAARAALLLTPDLSADCLFAHDDSTRELKDRLLGCVPRSTPEESPVTMTPVSFRFWLFKSTDH
jgi:hypothetical protein